MTVSTRRRIARISIWVCAATVVFAAVAFTVAPHAFPFSAVLRADVPAITAIIGFRFYLRGSTRRDIPSGKTTDQILGERDRYLAAVRAGGYGRQARREQLRLDALNRQARRRP